MRRVARKAGRGVASVLGALLLVGASLVSLVADAPPAAAFGSSQPPPVPSVSAGGYMSCGVQADQTAACWGENGVPSNDATNTFPGGMSTPPAGVKFLEVNAGYATACGVKTDHTLTCWGSARFDKLVVPPGTFTHVVPGLNYVCALGTDASITCWGGEVAGSDPNQLVKTAKPTTGVFTQLTMGNRHACALRDDAAVLCWGINAAGQTNTPAGTYKWVSAYGNTTCALRTDGTPVCWGSTTSGQATYPLGADNQVLTYTQISTGQFHVCGLRPDKTIVCWGRNFEGQASPVPPGTYTQVSTGTFHTCAIAETGPPARCWGNNQSGRVQPIMSSVPNQEGEVGAAYSLQLTMQSTVPSPSQFHAVSPAPTFSMVSGSLPPGLTLSPTGLLSGTPTAVGTYTAKVAATNGLSPPDCAVPVTLAAPNDFQSLPCVPNDPTSVATATRNVTITVTPVAHDDSFTQHGSDTALVVAPKGVLANDAPGNDPLVASVTTPPSVGILTANGDGSFTYQAPEDFLGTTSFTYKVTDGAFQSKNAATVTITVDAGCRGRAATITGTSGDNRLTGTARADVIAGLGGNDVIDGGAGDDVICGGSGNDRVSGGRGHDYVDGGSGTDAVRGGDGNDTLMGGADADTVLGEDGSDVLAGGSGSPDTCRGGTGEGVDVLAPDHGCEQISSVP